MKTDILKNTLYLALDESETHQSLGKQQVEVMKEALIAKGFERLVLVSNGRVFCSGGNLQDYAHMKSANEGREVNRFIRETLTMLDTLPVPKLAVVNGDCFGGGIELLSCFDTIYSTPSALFALWQAKMHLSFGWGGYERLLRRLPERHLMSWLYSGEPKSATRCQQLGLVDKLIPLHRCQQEIGLWEEKKVAASAELREQISSWKSDEVSLFDHLWWNEKQRKQLQLFLKK